MNLVSLHLLFSPTGKWRKFYQPKKCPLFSYHQLSPGCSFHFLFLSASFLQQLLLQVHSKHLLHFLYDTLGSFYIHYRKSSSTFMGIPNCKINYKHCPFLYYFVYALCFLFYLIVGTFISPFTKTEIKGQYSCPTWREELEEKRDNVFLLLSAHLSRSHGMRCAHE